MADLWFFVKLVLGLVLLMNVVMWIMDATLNRRISPVDTFLVWLTPLYWAWFITFNLM